MKTTRMLTILVMALGLMVCSAPIVHGAQYLTVNGQDVTSITVELGQSRTVEVVSTDSASYVDYVGFDNGAVLGDFSHLETKPEAGNLAAVVEYDQPAFYGYYVNATGISPAPSPGVHFIFEYMAQEVGETDLKLYDSTFTTVIDSIHITVIPLQPLPMATAFTYQGHLMDSNSPANGLYDFEFKLYDNSDPVFAAQQGNTIDINDLDVIDGRFTLELDFGSDVFNGDARWFEIAVRPGDSNDPNAFVSLSPRQELTPAPYALQTRGIFVDDSGNVCIGGTDPWYALDVYKAVSDSWVAGFHNTGTGSMDGGVIVRAFGGDPLLVQSATENVLNVKQNGNVGIGTESPQNNLHIYDAAGHTYVTAESERGYAFFIADGSYNSGLTLKENGTTKADVFWNTVNGSLSLAEGGVERLVVKGGNVGIGTAKPNDRLTIKGALSLEEISPPSETLGYGKIYVKDPDGELYFKNEAGTEYKLSAGGEDFIAGDYLLNANDTERTCFCFHTHMLIKETKIGRGGSLRIKFDAKSGYGGPANAQIRRNNTPVGTLHSIDPTSYVTYTEDISGWSKGDLVQVWGYSDGVLEEDIKVRNFRLYVDNPPVAGAHPSY